MKRLLFALLVLFAGAVQAANLVVGDVLALPGTSVIAEIRLDSPAEQVSGLQFKMTRPASVVSLSASEGPGAEAAEKGLSCASEGGEITCALFGINQNVVTSGSVIALLAIQVLETFAADETLALTNLSATGPGGNPIPLTATSGTLSVGSGPCDINRDGLTNISDAQIVINAILIPGTCGAQ
jgi:hypothetical protein